MFRLKCCGLLIIIVAIAVVLQSFGVVSVNIPYTQTHMLRIEWKKLGIVQQDIHKTNMVTGNRGRVVIRNAQRELYSAALEASENGGKDNQAIIDRENTAWTHKGKRYTVIGDHNSQGFRIVKDFDYGDHMIIYDINGNRQVYVCEKKCRGINNGKSLKVDLNDPRSLDAVKTAGLTYVTYTCIDFDLTGTHVWLAFWRPIHN